MSQKRKEVAGMEELRALWMDEDGIGTVELILILVEILTYRYMYI